MAAMTISQIAKQAGVRPSALRYYESIGLLPAPKRVSGQRRYEDTALQRLAVIQTAQRAGFTLDEIRILCTEILPSLSPVPQWRDLVQRKLQELDTLLLHVQSMKTLLEDVMHCDDPELADCIFVTGQKHKIPRSE